MDYVSIPDVELVSVGMSWHGANGDLTFTFEHLADAMEAANEDPLIQSPRLKLGHSDPRFADEKDPGHDPFYDGEPAFGHVENLRLENDGAVLVGDFVDVPAWLGDALPTAYPSRSIEGAWVDGGWDVETQGGKRYTFVLTAVALLGLYRPAVEDLEDLKRLIVNGEGLVVTGGAEPDAAMGDVKIFPSARADHSRVIDTFYADVAVEEDGRYWWWVRSLWTDPNELIVDDDEGHLFRVPFSSDDGQAVSFEEPLKVLEVFVDMPSEQAAKAAATPGHKGRPARTFAEASASRPEARKPAEKGGVGAPATTDDMDSAKLRTVLGLEAEATDAEVEARLDERAAELARGSEDPDPAPGEGDPSVPDPDPLDPASDPAPPTDPAPTPDPAGDPSTDPNAPGPGPNPAPAEDVPPPTPPPAETTVTVDKETWEQTQRQAREGAAARSEQIVEARERLLEKAVKAGKFPPARADHYRKLHKADAAGTEELIESLEAGTVPVDQRGTSGEVGTEAELGAVMATFPGYGSKRGDG